MKGRFDRGEKVAAEFAITAGGKDRKVCRRKGEKVGKLIAPGDTSDRKKIAAPLIHRKKTTKKS